MRVLDVATLAQWVEAAPVNDSAQVGPDVVIDTRKVTPGALFIALPGTRVDGHDFTQAAQDTGAAAVLVLRLLAQRWLRWDRSTMKSEFL